MKAIITFVFGLIFCFAGFANAQSAQRFFQTIRLPSAQTVLEHQVIPAPIVATTNYVLTTNAGPTSAAALTVNSFAHQPDVPRTITITPTGTTGDVESCAVVVTGTNILGKTISDTLTFAANASTAQTSIKAFKTVSSITWPANCESGGFAATWIVGVGSALGVQRCTKNAGAYAWSVFNGAYETTRGTFTSNASDVSQNLFAPNGTPDGTKDVELYYSQNFACY